MRVPATKRTWARASALGLGLIFGTRSASSAAKFKLLPREGAGAIPETVDDNGESNHMVIKAPKGLLSTRASPPRVRFIVGTGFLFVPGSGSSAAIVGGLVVDWPWPDSSYERATTRATPVAPEDFYN